MKPMITREDFIARISAAQKASRRRDMIFVPLLFTILILLMVSAKWVDQKYNGDAPAWIVFLTFGVLFGLIIIGGLASRQVGKRLLVKNGFPCPGCSKPLVPRHGRGTTTQITIATGKCGHCGVALFSAIPSTSSLAPTTPTITKEEFITRIHAAKQATRRAEVISITFLITGLILFMVTLKWAAKKYGEHPSTGVKILSIGITIGLIIVWAKTSSLAHKRIMAKHGLACPGCGEQLASSQGQLGTTSTTSQITLATGKCGHCGATLFQE